ncbi:hypothetical protein KYI11_10865 [Macrococcoides bohemicum]|uniref:Uncharacterized protein n=1 Tax=Macrococcoides bohemicum TaxID=1903056 RepID=A0AAJ4PAI2_9STAP|nr:hypothetical protein [Macrococcus bohemicus]QYA42084.1 hypothetical protein KYI11_10865 [Macrococcus bohemicus]
MKIKVVELQGDFEKQINNIIHELEQKKRAQVVDIRYLYHGKQMKAVIHYVSH